MATGMGQGAHGRARGKEGQQQVAVLQLTVNRPAPTTKNFFLSSLQRAGGMCQKQRAVPRLHLAARAASQAAALAAAAAVCGKARPLAATCLFQSISVWSAMVDGVNCLPAAVVAFLGLSTE